MSPETIGLLSIHPALATALTILGWFILGWVFGEVRDRMQEWQHRD